MGNIIEALEGMFIPQSTRSGFFNSNPGSFKKTWNSKVMIGNKSYREVAEVLVFKDDKVYLRADKEITRIPGGSTDPDMSMEETCIHEAREEAHLLIKNIKYIGREVRDFKACGWKPGRGDYTGGKVAYVFRAEFNGTYTGPVDPADVDEGMLTKGKWYSLDEAMKIVSSKLYKQAIEEYMNNITR